MMQSIIYHICNYYKIPSKQIFANTRKYETVFYRHLFFYLTKEISNKTSYSKIVEFSFRYNCDVRYNHATLVNAVKKIKNQLSYDKKLQKEVEELIERIKLDNEPQIVVKHVDLLSLCGKNINQ